MRNNYKKALRIAAEAAYQSEIVQTGMESMLIKEFAGPGEFGYTHETKHQWIDEQVENWLEEANK